MNNQHISKWPISLVGSGGKLVAQWTMPGEPGMLATHSLSVSIIIILVSVNQSVSETYHADVWPSPVGHLRFFHIVIQYRIRVIMYTRTQQSLFFHHCSKGDLDTLCFWSIFRVDLNFQMCNSINCFIVALMQGGILLGSSLSLERMSGYYDGLRMDDMH